MKFRVTFLLLFLISLTGSQIFSQGFNSVATSNGTNVVAVGNAGLVWRSANSGSSWESYTLGGANLMSVTAFGNNFWITGSDGRVYKGDVTSPGSLSAQTVDNTVSLNCVMFIDANTGFMCGSGGNIYKTVNGGSTWMSSSSGLNSQNLNGISFQNSSNGIVVGANGTIFYTTNGGSSWQASTSGTTKTLNDVKYFTGGAIVVGNAGTLLLNPNTGTYTPVSSKTWEDIKSVSGSSYSTARVCGGGGFIRNNKYSNTNFLNFEKNPMYANLVDVCYADTTTAFAVSSLNKAIIKTNDGGASWTLTGGATLSYSLTNTNLSGSGIGNGFAYHPTNRDIMYICHGSTVYRTGDRGQTWTQIATVTGGGQCHSFYVSPLDTNMMIASLNSSGGKVMRSTNYGSTWTQTFSGTLTSYGMPLEMDQNNPTVMYLAPDGAVVRKSTDFGATWTNLSNRTFRSPCDIAIQYGNSTVMYLGDGVTSSGIGGFFRSTDGGVSWDSIHPSGSSEIPMIGNTVMDTNLVFHTCWSSGGVWRSFNKFVNFTQVSTTGSAWACDLAKDDPTAFSFFTYNGAGYISMDIGTAYTNVGSLPNVNAGMAYINKGTLLVQSGSGVTKVNFNYNATATPVVVTGTEGTASSIPSEYNLYQNYPNPFNPSTSIQFDLPESGNVVLKVYNQLGKEIAVISNGYKTAGRYEENFDASALSSGVYFYKLQTKAGEFTKKMLLVK